MQNIFSFYPAKAVTNGGFGAFRSRLINLEVLIASEIKIIDISLVLGHQYVFNGQVKWFCDLARIICLYVLSGGISKKETFPYNIAKFQSDKAIKFLTVKRTI